MPIERIFRAAPILRYPDARLRTISSPVEKVTDDTRDLADVLVATVRNTPRGLGISAPQIGVPLRVIVAFSERRERATPYVLVNPDVTLLSPLEGMNEGCLSFPDIYEQVKRSPKVSVRFLDSLTGLERTETFEGVLAQVVQHEVDHLDGKLLLDYAARPRKRLIERRLGREKK